MQGFQVTVRQASETLAVLYAKQATRAAAAAQAARDVAQRYALNQATLTTETRAGFDWAVGLA